MHGYCNWKEGCQDCNQHGVWLGIYKVAYSNSNVQWAQTICGVISSSMYDSKPFYVSCGVSDTRNYKWMYCASWKEGKYQNYVLGNNFRKLVINKVY